MSIVALTRWQRAMVILLSEFDLRYRYVDI